MTHREKVTDEELEAEMRRLAEALGHTPTIEDLDRDAHWSASLYQQRYGTLRDAQRAAGCVPNGFGFKSPYPPPRVGDGRVTQQEAETRLSLLGWEPDRSAGLWRWREVVVIADFHLRSHPEKVVEVAERLGPSEENP